MTSTVSHYNINDRVFIHGLIKANHLNNLIGIVQNQVKNSPRLEILIVHLDKTVSIKPDNISIATARNEIESILQHLARDQKSAFMPEFSAAVLPYHLVDYQTYLKLIKSAPHSMHTLLLIDI